MESGSESKIDKLVEEWVVGMGKDQGVKERLFGLIRSNASRRSRTALERQVVSSLLFQLSSLCSIRRFVALSLCGHLFLASSVFRGLFVAELPRVLQRTIDSFDAFKMPNPALYKEKCARLAVHLIEKWNKKFGLVHRQLDIALTYLKTRGFYPYPSSSSSNQPRSSVSNTSLSIQRAERISRERHDAYLLAINEWEEKRVHIEENIAKIKQLIRLLVNNFGDVFDGLGESGPSTAIPKTHRDIVQAYGLGTASYTLEIEIPTNPVDLADPENEENRVLYDELRECRKLLQRHLTFIQSWIRVVSLEEVEPQTTVGNQLKMFMDLKSTMEILNSKASILIENAKSGTTDANDKDDEDFDDEVFEEIPIGKAANIPTGESSSSSASKLPILPLDQQANSTIPSLSSSSSFSSKLPPPIPRERIHLPSGSTMQDLLKAAPVVDYDQDLYFWDKKDIPFNTTGIDFHHRFLGDGKGENLIPETIMQDLRKRTVVVPIERVEYPPCRARLNASGKLCPRRDKVKCPLHGPIVPRNDWGEPVDPNHVALLAGKDAKGKGKLQQPLWQELEGEVNRAVGESSSLVTVKKRKSALDEELELMKTKDNVRARMEKVLKKFNKKK